MKRKFSFDIPIPKLKIGSLRPESTSHPQQQQQQQQQQQPIRGLLPSPPESPPPTPKSVRPPLPADVDADLRAACTHVITRPKPSHQARDRSATRPALDYASIKADAEWAPVVPARTRSTRHLAGPSHASSKPSCKPPVATEHLLGNEHSGNAMPQARARSRAHQLMAGGAVAAPAPASRHARSSSHPLPPTTLRQPASYPTRVESAAKPRTSGRSGSVGTSASSPHTDSTDYPWSASTALTSAAITPARSKRTSSHAITSGSESGSAPKIEPVNAEWMRSELEKHKRLIEDRGRAVAAQAATLAQPARPSPTPHIFAQVPARKPVPARPGSSQAKETPRAGIRRDMRHDNNKTDPCHADHGGVDNTRPGSTRQAPHAENRGRLLARSSSRLGKAARSANRAVVQAANKAESITNDIVTHYFRPNSDQTAQDAVERPRGRARNYTSNVKDYFRPASAAGNRSRPPSIDYGRGHKTSQSFDSQRSGGALSDHSLRWQGRLFNRSRSHVAVSVEDASSHSADASQSQSQQQKPLVDLNRELPPLPSLDRWNDEEPAITPAHVPVRRGTTPEPDKSSFRTPTVEGLHSALSRKDIRYAASPQLVGSDHVASALLASPTPPRPGKPSVDAKRLTSSCLGNHQLPSPPPLSASSPLVNESDLFALSLSQSVEPRPSGSCAIGNDGPDHLRPLAQKPPLTPEKATRRKSHVADYTRHAGPPVGGNARTWSRAGTISSTPLGHSRESSDQASVARQYSMDEYSRQNDTRYQNTLEVKSTHSKEKKRHWWQAGKDKTQAWMDQVKQPGAKSGMLKDDHGAGAPVVRY